MEMRVQIIDDKQLKNCSICKATDEWVENICVNGIEGLYCVKCDTLTLYEPLPSKLVYLAFKKKCMQIKVCSILHELVEKRQDYNELHTFLK